MTNYPPEYDPKFDLEASQRADDTLSATALFAELSNIAESVNQSIAYIKSVVSVDMKLKPNQTIATKFVIEDEQTATAAQTVITYANSVVVDPSVATVGVFINGDRLPASQTAVGATTVTVTPALTLNDNILLEIHDNGDSVFADLLSTLSNLGASLIGIEDTAGQFGASNVEDALAEGKASLDSLITNLGDLTKILRANVTVPWEIVQNAGGFKLTNLADGTAQQDAVTVGQISSVLATLNDLGSTFLPLLGGVMAGPINMGGNRITNVRDPVANKDAANKEYVDAVDTKAGSMIPTLGLQDPDFASQAENIGSLSHGEAASSTADSTQNASSTVKTTSGVPKPGAPDHVANKQALDDLEGNLINIVSSLAVGGGGSDAPSGVPTVGVASDGCILDGSGLGAPVADINSGGVYNFTTLTVTAAQTPAQDTFMFASGNITLNNNITMATRVLEISCGGDLTISSAATITCRQLLIRCTGTVTLDGVIVAQGDTFAPSALYPTGRGLAGFVRISAGAAFNQGALSTINSEVINIQIVAASTLAGTMTADITNSHGYGNSGGGGGGRGATFGFDIGYRASHMGELSEFLDANGNTSIAQQLSLNFKPYQYSGEGGQGGAAGGSGGGGGGGTAGGAGGAGQSGRTGGRSRLNGTYRSYLYPRHPGAGGGGGSNVTGSLSGNGGRAGGVIIIYCAGDLTLTGYTASANGTNGGSTGGSRPGGGGGGGGSVRIVSAGIITDGTAGANGGNSSSEGAGSGGGGGGGSAFILGSTLAGSQSVSATGGTTVTDVAGAVGDTLASTLTATEIVCLATASYWRN